MNARWRAKIVFGRARVQAFGSLRAAGSIAFALLVSSGAFTLPALSQQQAPPATHPGMPGMSGPYTKGQILGVQGYYEVLPSGAVVLYPATPVTAPGVMNTILGMFGGNSMVGRRGYFRITPRGELHLYFPPGTVWPGMQGGTSAPGVLGPQRQPPR